MSKKYYSKLRLVLLISLIFITPLGFATKFYRGLAQDWVANNFSGVLYEIFWCLLIKFFAPELNNFFIASAVFGVTTILEFLQLWHPFILEIIRSNFLGRTLIGNSFSWIDLPHYLIGSCLGWLILWLLERHYQVKLASSSERNCKK